MEDGGCLLGTYPNKILNQEKYICLIVSQSVWKTMTNRFVKNIYLAIKFDLNIKIYLY